MTPEDRRPASGPRAWVVPAVLLLAFGISSAAALGMHRGVLLSNAVKGILAPWRGLYPERVAEAQVLTDPVWQFVPWLELARRELGSGRLPLWNPHQDGGVPLLGNSVSALGSPLVWPVLALGVAHGWNLSLLLRVLVAAASAWLWLREAGRSRTASALGAAGFAMSGAFVAWLEHPQTMTTAPIPLLLVFVRRLARSSDRERGGRDGVWLALSTALVLAGGHPETALMAALFAIAQMAASSRSWSDFFRPVGPAVVGALLAAPLLVPFLEYLGLSEAIHGHDRRPMVLPAVGLLRFLLPSAPVSHPIEGAATVSLAVLALLPFGLRSPVRSREHVAWAIVAVVSLAVTFDNPLARLLAEETPMYWTRFLLLLPLPLGFLAAAGLDGLRRAAEDAGGPARGRLAAGLGAGLVGLATLELLVAAKGVHAVTPREELDLVPEVLRRLSAETEAFRILPLHTFLPANTATLYGLDDVRGYDALAPLGFRVRRAAMGRFGGPKAPVVDALEPWDFARGGAALDFWNVKYILYDPRFTFSAPELNRRFGLDLEVAWEGPDARVLLNRRVSPRVRWQEGSGEIRIVSRTPLRWDLEVRADGPGRLLVANPWFPGWSARVDGRRVALRLEPGDPVVIDVPAGRSRVSLAYRPGSFRLGLGLFAVGVLGLWFRLARPRSGTLRPGIPSRSILRIP